MEAPALKRARVDMPWVCEVSKAVIEDSFLRITLASVDYITFLVVQNALLPTCEALCLTSRTPPFRHFYPQIIIQATFTFLKCQCCSSFAPIYTYNWALGLGIQIITFITLEEYFLSTSQRCMTDVIMCFCELGMILDTKFTNNIKLLFYTTYISSRVFKKFERSFDSINTNGFEVDQQVPCFRDRC